MKSINENNFFVKIIILIWLTLLVLSACGLLVEASVTTYRPTYPDEYFELRAATINKDVNGQRQLIMELYGHNIDFEGFEVRFEYDKTKLQPSIISTSNSSQTNIGVEPSEVSKYFKFVGEFAGTGGQKPILEFEADTSEINADNVIVAKMALNLQEDDGDDGYESIFDIPTSAHVVERNDSKAITTTTENGEGVKLGEMSFRMLTDDTFILTDDPEDTQSFYFGLVPNKEAKLCPKTGIKVQLNDERDYDIDGQKDYNKFHAEDKETFIFTDMTASEDADLADLIVSSGEVNTENPSESTYKEYDLNPEFKGNEEVGTYTLTLMEYIDTINIKATQSDENATMKITVPKHDSDGNLVYKSDGTTIEYEEKDMADKVPFEVELNKLGDPDTKVKIIVTAEDEVTTNTYEIIIKRPYAIIRGKAILADFDNQIIAQNFLDIYGTILNHKVEINIYKADLARWEEIPDIYHTMSEDPFNYEDLAKIPKETTIESEEDGAFEIYIIPGKYDLQIERASFLDYIYSDVELKEGDNIDMGEIRLTAGDANRDGVITVEDISLIKKVMDMEDEDPSFKENYNPTQTGTVIIEDLKYVKTNIDEEIQIVNFK